MVPKKVRDCCSIIAAVLLVSVVRLTSASASNTSCPTWFYYNNSTRQCECGHGLDCSDDNKVLIQNGYCATSSGQGDQYYYFGICLFGHPVNRTNRMYSEMPSDPDMLDDVMCGPYNRKGFLCEDCIDGYGPAVYSVDMKCANCSKLSLGYAITLYCVLGFLPTTLLFICLVVFRLNITSGPLLGHMIFCQVYIQWGKENPYVFAYTESHVSTSIRALFKFLLTLSQFWNLDYFQTVIPPFCISDKLTNIQVIILNLVPATYPIVLVITTCILMELHGRNCRIIHILWKPFSIILNKTNITAVTSDAVIQAFASFIFLSNIKVLATAAGIQTAHKIIRYNNSFYKRGLLYQPSIEPYSTAHILYTSISAVPVITVTLIPSLLLTIYPTRLYRYLSRFVSARKRLAITAFAEALNSHLKDGLNGTRDYRWLAGFPLLLMVLNALFTSFLENILLYDFLIVNVFVVMCYTTLTSYVQPCKLAVANISLSFHFLLYGFCEVLVYEWFNDLDNGADKLELTFVVPLLISHSLMFAWAGYKLTYRVKKCRFNPSGYKVVLTDIVKQYVRPRSYQEVHSY